MQSSSTSFRIVEFIFRIFGWIIVSIWGIQFGGWLLNLVGNPQASELLVT